MNPAILLLIAFQAYWFQQNPANPPGTVPGTYPPVSQKNWAVLPKPGDDNAEEKRPTPRPTASKDAVEKTGGRNEEAEDDADWDLIHSSGLIVAGPRTTAKRHVVTKGETLWDLAEKYFGDPLFWPELWSWNAHITNPHWLFPGTVVNLTSRPEVAVEESSTDQEEKFYGLEFQKGTVTVRNRAFIDEETLKESRAISGSPEEKSLLTVGDIIYIKDPDKKLKPGSVYTVFRPIQKVSDPQNKQVLGQLVQILGEVRIREHRPEGVLKAEITRSIAVINRKDLVGKVQTSFKQVTPVVQKREKPIVARVVATIEETELLSANDMVVVNLGKEHQLKPGAILPLIVRGDGLYTHLHPLDPSRKQDSSFPYETKGTLVVYEVHEKYSFAVILRSEHPIRVGDEVLFGDVPDAPEKPAAEEKP
ncbi:LysM peptidoglycan-binding domain-containing protein [Myxococcota bacterium]|nr:LysM peptidoglycan-binding domain-containing protein [Myxococcota bacterium]MBU1510776.1 LysM peptidoglycan-binding domain-containing protein [Myxococcota bacterium]